MTDTDVVWVVATTEDADTRVDVVLARRMPGLSRKAAKALVADGRVRQDGRRVRSAERCSDGARLEVRLDRPSGELPPVEVLHADPAYVYVLKPAGTHTVRLRPQDPPTLADAVAVRFPECRDAGAHDGEAGALHRLDKETSGVVAFARSAEAWAEGRNALTTTATKLYLARCHNTEDGPGAPAGVSRWNAQPPWSPEAPLQRPHGEGIRVCAPLSGTGPRGAHMVVHAQGQPAESRIWWLPPRTPSVRDAVVELVSGRRHQARVHLAHLGTPILADDRYGPERTVDLDAPAASLHLHAVGLRLCPQRPWVWAPLPIWF